MLSGGFDADGNGHEDKVQSGANLVKKQQAGQGAPRPEGSDRLRGHDEGAPALLPSSPALP